MAETERRGGSGRPDRVTVIVPTLDEADNIDPLIQAILDHGRAAAFDLEVLVVDDGSRDGTREKVRAWEGSHPVSLLEREGERGLSGAVLAGARAASGDVVVVMDADLSHPPDSISSLARPVLDGACDMAVGSRHVPGGSTPGWPFSRRLVSRAAAALAWPIADIRDPLSGFFAVRPDRLLDAGKEASGFKIGLEVLARGGEGLRVQEVPIEFRDRERGRSKLGPRVAGAYLKQLAALAGGAVSAGTALRFALVGLVGLGADLLVFNLLLLSGLALGPSHIGSFAAAAAVNYLLNARWAFGRGPGGPFRLSASGYAAFALVALLGLFLRGGVLAACTRGWGWPPQLAILPAVLAAAAVNYFGCAFFVFPRPAAAPNGNLRWRVASIGILLYLFSLRLAYLGQVDLIPEEAYYWNYSQHLDLGYLDHPPMVAWLIGIGTFLFGHSEFGVRLGAEASWLLALLFVYGYTRNLLGKSEALRAAMLLAALPFFFLAGFLMMPDSPLVACWAGALYFLERALLGEQRGAWWGVGICMGLGLLSKYPMALVGVAALAYVLIDRPSRRWLRRPEPYLAALLAALIFSPVLLWNVEHGWASFLFQGERRWSHSHRFELPELLGSVILLITPLGLWGFLSGSLRRAPGPDGRAGGLETRRRAFVWVFTLLPLAVFVWASLRNDTKLNWTGPLWLAALPAMALSLSGRPGASRPRWVATADRLWKPMLVALIPAYGAGLHFPVLGLPGVKYPENYYGMSWRDLGRQVEEIELEVMAETGAEPLMVGMDKYHLSSAAAFYDPNLDGAHETAGWHLFGRRSLMYEYWFPPRLQEGKTLVLFAQHPRDLDSEMVRSRVERLEPVRELLVRREGQVVGRYYSRVAYGYKSGPAAAPPAAEDR